MVNSNSNTLRDVMKADISLGNSGASNCWTRQMKDAFGDLQNGTVYRSDLLQCRKLKILSLFLFCSAKPPIKVCFTSPPSPREKEATAQATH
jgi:hypothetical protein